MKKFALWIVRFKSLGGLFFTGVVMVQTMARMLMGQFTLSVWLVWQALLIAAVCSALTLLFTSDAVIKKAPVSARIGLIAALYGFLIACAGLFGWFPLAALNLMWFTLAYLFVLGVMAAVFRVYHRMVGQRFEESLTAYRDKKDG